MQDLSEIARKEGGLRLPVAQVFDLKDIAAASKVSRTGKVMLSGAE